MQTESGKQSGKPLALCVHCDVCGANVVEKLHKRREHVRAKKRTRGVQRRNVKQSAEWG